MGNHNPDLQVDTGKLSAAIYRPGSIWAIYSIQHRCRLDQRQAGIAVVVETNVPGSRSMVNHRNWVFGHSVADGWNALCALSVTRRTSRFF